MNTDTKTKKATHAEIRRWLKNHKSWPRYEPKLNAAVDRFGKLGLFQQHAATHWFIGGVTATLQSQGSISRAKFIELLDAATSAQSNQPAPSDPCPSVVKK